MQFGRKKTLMDRAHDVVEQVTETVSETVIPHLETALEQTREKAGPALIDARERALPLIAEGRAIAAEKAALASERASVGAAIAAERAQVGAALAADRAAVGRTLAAAKMAELRGEPVAPEPEGGRLKKVLLLGGLLALGGVLFSKLRGGKKESANWQSSYVPTPPPAPTDRPQTDTTVAAATTEEGDDLVPPTGPGADPLNDPLVPDTETEDIGGGAPGEAISDTVEEPRQPTTPDAPANVIDIDDAPRDR